MNTANDFYTSGQAREKLKVSTSTFKTLVDSGTIRKVTPPGKKQGYYVKDDVDKIAEEREVFSRIENARKRSKKNNGASRNKEEVIIDWLYAKDVPAGLKLSQMVYPGEVDLAEAAIYQAWRKNNPYLTMAAFSQDRNECYASIQLVPLANEQVILDVLSGRREEASIQPDEIVAYDKPGPYNLLVVSATCLPDRPQLLYQILYRYTKFWIEQYPERYIKRVYAQAVSESGMRIVQHFFMSPRLDLAYNAFMIDMAYPSASRMIREFKQRLTEKAALPADLQWPPLVTAQ